MERSTGFRANSARALANIWKEAGRTWGGSIGLLLGFGVVHYVCVWLGYNLKVGEGNLSWIWPASGSLIVTLWLAPARLWAAVILIQWGVEASFASQMDFPFAHGWSGWFLLANTLEGLVTVSLVRLLSRNQYEVNLGKVLVVLFATCVGAAVGGFLGSYAAMNVMGHEDFIRSWQTWWAGNWLGALTIAPMMYGWLVPLRKVYVSLHQQNRWEALLYALTMAPLTWWMFSLPPGQQGSILQFPVFLTALLVIAALRLPPRWSVSISSMVTLIAVYQTSNGLGPYVVQGPFDIVVWGQFSLVLMVVITLMVSSFTAERAMATEQLAASETRYRTFIEFTSEAVARMEMARPLPLNLPREQVREWFLQQARIAESNQAFQQLNLGPLPGNADDSPTTGTGAWTSLIEQFLDRLLAGHLRCEGLRLNIPAARDSRAFMVSFEAVVTDGHLERVWCIANEITEIVNLNSRLLRDQERIKSYARQIISADERARRATAVDLHDGIAQSLVAMGMMLKVLRDQPGDGRNGLIDDLSTNLRSVQERTRTMIADLSPPGLYELGLQPALQWLSVRFRSHDQLHVELDCNVQEERIPMELRILIFKLIRELLRNVVKHSGVEQATVNVWDQAGQIHVQVMDSGKGFDWQLDMFSQRSGSFGLWSIAERISEMGGDLNVDTAPGRGARFTMSFPLDRGAKGALAA